MDFIGSFVIRTDFCLFKIVKTVSLLTELDIILAYGCVRNVLDQVMKKTIELIRSVRKLGS